METPFLLVRPFHREDELQVIELWRRCGLVRPTNDPGRDIARKLAHSPELFLVGTMDSEVVATAMAGYDGHRGWINYLAVAPERRNAGFGTLIMEAAERLLRELGCPKINVQVRTTNSLVHGFYNKIGFVEDAVTSLGKRLVHDR